MPSEQAVFLRLGERDFLGGWRVVVRGIYDLRNENDFGPVV